MTPCLKTKTSRVRRGFVIGGKIDGLKAKSDDGFLGMGQQPPSSPVMGLGEHCELPSRIWGEATTAQRFCHYFQHSGWPLLTL